MIRNPIYSKDKLNQNRSLGFPLLISAINIIVAAIILINLFSLSISAMYSGEILYRRFLRVYYIAIIFEFILVVIISPAIAVSSVNDEIDGEMLDLILSTELDIPVVIRGKLLATLSTILVIGISTVPAITSVYIYGGISLRDIILIIFFYFTISVYAIMFGIFNAIELRIPALSLAISYILVFISVGIIFLLYYKSNWIVIEKDYIIYGSLIIMNLISCIIYYASIRSLRKKMKR